MPVEIPTELATARDRIASLADRRSLIITASDIDDPDRRDQLSRLDHDIGDLIADLQALVDPCDASPQVPLVLLPVRVETKLLRDTTTLRVNIKPDEVHVDSLSRTVTEGELAAGHEYWHTIWTVPESSEAWGDLLTAVGERRAPWVAYVTTPTNLAELGHFAPEFPDRPTEATHGIVARCLPDQFVVRVFPHNADAVTVVGTPVARDVPISPLALGDEDPTDPSSLASGLPVPAGSEWTVDFAAAKAKGLAVEVELPPGTKRIDRVVVVGTRNSVDESANAEEFADLLASHRFSHGMSLLAAGTPTNNAETDRTPFRDGEAGSAPPSTPPEPTDDATRFARLLGLDPQDVALLLGADPASSQHEAETSANTALWFATWEPVLRRIEDAEVDDVTPSRIESARQLHRNYVRGSGPSQALRVGAQPYGILPVTDLHRWSPRHGETTASFVDLITRTLDRWIAHSTVVPRVRAGDQVSDEDLLEIMGTSPQAIGVRVRPVADGHLTDMSGAATGADTDFLHAETQLAKAILAQYSVEAATNITPPSPHDETRTVALPLVAERDKQVVEEILAGQTPKIDSVLQALLEVAWKEAQRNRVRAVPDEFVSPILDLIEVDPDVGQLIRVAMSTTSDPDADSERLFEAAEQLRTVKYFDEQPTDPIGLAALEPIAEARTSLAQVALTLEDLNEAKWIGSNAIAGLLFGLGLESEVRAAMHALCESPIDERRIAVAHALDVASHRADAWATALADSRRATLQASHPTGMTLGAFGYVEEIRLDGPDAGSQGWIHTPSTTHAVAAGMLASAHRSNIGAKDGHHPFAIDLSSRRGAELRRALEGVNAGQAIGALLGYQIERGLTGSAARFQLSLRELAPMATDELGNLEAQGAEQARIAAADVVDGVTLLRLYPVGELGGTNPPLRIDLSEPPTNRFLDDPWVPATDQEWETVVKALRNAADTLDAFSDALLSESVLQHATGNTARASAAMDAMSSGSAVEPGLGVLGVPQRGEILTHNLFAAIAEDANGWSTTRPRALAEPRLEAWAARRLGRPSDIVLADADGDRIPLSQAGWAALDIVFADDIGQLERDLRAAIPTLGDAPLVSEPGEDWPESATPFLKTAALAGTLRALIAGASPVSPDSLVRTGEPAQRVNDIDELIGRCQELLRELKTALDAAAPVIAVIDSETLTVAEAQVSEVADAVSVLASFGVPLAPDPQIPTNVDWAWNAWHAASARYADASQRLEAVSAPRDPAWTPEEQIDECQAIAETILGDGFLLLPILRPDTAPGDTDKFLNALIEPPFEQPPRAKINAFVRDHATVHRGVARLAEAQLLGAALRNPVPLTIAQLTERQAAGTDRWLAGPLADDQPWPAAPATHLVLELVSETLKLGGPFAGLSIDGWSETLPYQPGPRALDPNAPDSPLRAHKATTGLAVHSNQASARAPQVLLSAISPDGERWTTDTVIQSVLCAIDVAKARLVTLERVPGDAAILPAIYIASPWLQPRTGLSFLELAALRWSELDVPFISEVD